MLKTEVRARARGPRSAAILVELRQRQPSRRTAQEKRSKRSERMIRTGRNRGVQMLEPLLVGQESNIVPCHPHPEQALAPVSRSHMSQVRRLLVLAGELDYAARYDIDRLAIQPPVEIGRKTHADAAADQQRQEVVRVERAGSTVSGNEAGPIDLDREAASTGLAHQRFGDHFGLRVA